MEFNLEIRKKQLQSLKQYVRSSEDNVKAVFQCLGWDPQKTLESDDSKRICPVNKNHLISNKTFQDHLEICKLKSNGYEKNETFLSEPNNDDCSIKLSSAKKLEVLGAAKGNKSEFRTAWNGRDLDPLTSDRLTSTFSVDERLALYDYSIKHTKAPPKPEEFTLDLSDSKEKKELSDKDRLALERDAKRRRAKYKSVHTSKKSQTEIMREMIDNQMTLYTDWIKQKQAKARREKERLKRLAREKKSCSDQNDDYDNQYQYIGTTYDQNIQSTGQWNQSVPYTGTYDTQYYTFVETNKGVITDWSHLYQGGIDTDVYTNIGHYQPEEGEYMESSSTIPSTHIAYSNSALNTNFDATSNTAYENQNLEKEVNHKTSSLLKESFRYENEKRENNKSKEDSRREILKPNHRLRENRTDQRYLP